MSVDGRVSLSIVDSIHAFASQTHYSLPVRRPYLAHQIQSINGRNTWPSITDTSSTLHYRTPPKSSFTTTATTMDKTFIHAITHTPTPLLGCSITLPSLSIAKIVARSGFSWTLIDMEHSPQSPEHVMNVVHAVVGASGGSCFPLIRVPSHGLEWIKWATDSGAQGVIVPMVDTAEQMKQIVDAALYPPKGNRSWGPNNAVFGQLDSGFGTTEYLGMAREGGVAVIPMIESKKGVENVEEILAVEGVSAVFIGPQDLRMSLGLKAGRSGEEREFEEALDKVVKAAERNGLPVGSIGVGGELAVARARQGMKFLLCGLDRAGFVAGITGQLKGVKEALDKL